MEAKKLNNIAGSTGYSNLWIYSAAGNKAEVKVSGFFDEGVDYGIRNHDTIICSCADASFMARLIVTGGGVAMVEMDTLA